MAVHDEAIIAVPDAVAAAAAAERSPMAVHDEAIIAVPIDVQAIGAQPKHKCDVRGCPSLPSGVMKHLCDADDCLSLIHKVCYERIVCKSDTRIPVADKCFCTCKHHDSFVKNLSAANLSWTNDGPNGRDDPETSQYWLVDWLSTGDNYNKYRSIGTMFLG